MHNPVVFQTEVTENRKVLIGRNQFFYIYPTEVLFMKQVTLINCWMIMSLKRFSQELVTATTSSQLPWLLGCVQKGPPPQDFWLISPLLFFLLLCVQLSWRALSSEHLTLKPVQLHRILTQYQLTAEIGPVPTWQASSEDEAYIYRTGTCVHLWVWVWVNFCGQ